MFYVFPYKNGIMLPVLFCNLLSPLRLLDLFVCDITFLLPGTYVLFYLF